MTTPLDVDWGNLPFSNFYLPFMQSLVRYLCRRRRSTTATSRPASRSSATLEASPLNRTVTLHRPGDARSRRRWS